MQKNAPFPPFSPPFDEGNGEGAFGSEPPDSIRYRFVSFRFVSGPVSLGPIRFPFFRYRAAAITCSLGSQPPLGGLIPTCMATCGARNSAISLSLFS